LNALPPGRLLGPYRLEGRLGRGGMGEVYRAFDERLERAVAVKLIRPETADDLRARERFRREARAAAALNHPAIVQIHDILETPEGDAIVMELVAGETLASLLATGPLDLPRALRLGVEIAEGLAAAHARGIIHRDLKPENVMVTADGWAKILDFGLAKRHLGEGEGEASLSVAGTVLGTYRSMSPEQARGLPVDARSDLFALGSLLYEALTGVSPFAGGTVLETLTRICTARQRPAAELRPEVPAALSELVDRLLEKDPARRPESAFEVAAALAESTEIAEIAGPFSRASSPRRSRAAGALPDDLPTLVDGRPLPTLPAGSETPATAALAGTSRPWRRAGWRWALAAALLAALALGLFAWARLARGGGKRLYVAVPKPQIGRGADLEGAKLLASGLRVALLSGLLDLEGVSTLAPEQVDLVPGPPRDLARAVAADEVLTSRLDCSPASCQVELAVVRRDGSLRWTRSFPSPVDQPNLLAEAVAGHLREAYAERGRRRETVQLDVRPADYAEYLRLREAFDARRQDLSPDALLARLAEVERGSPNFLEARMLEAEVLRVRFTLKRSAADLAAAAAALEVARRIAPTDPRPLYSQFEIALAGGQLAEAGAALAALERLEPGDVEVGVQRARLLERRGDTRRALDLMRQAVRRRDSWKNVLRLADMEYRLGESAAARRDLAALLARLPSLYQARSLLAQVELASGNPERAAALYRELDARGPQLIVLANLGVCELLLRRYPEAEARFRQAAALAPQNLAVALNLADARLLRGDRAGAAALYRDLLSRLAGEPAAATDWQLQSIRAQALAHLGERRQAAEAVQQVLVLAQGNAQAAQEAALVDTLIGDQAAALANAARALEQGVQPIWFTLPWYDPLRAAPEFQALLKPPAAHLRP
jgi:eukaryotic-like serine/threonine-protein kinase